MNQGQRPLIVGVSVTAWLGLGALLLSLAACSSMDSRDQQQVVAIRQPGNRIVVGKTTIDDITHLMGKPDETLGDQRVEVWVYRDLRDLPRLVGLLPGVGDLATLASLSSKNQELIIQFDRPAGVVSKYKLRALP